MWKKAPLLIGRAVVVRGGDDGPGTWAGTFFPALAGGLLAVMGTGLALSWWFRRGDRRAHGEIEAVRHQNPFDGPG